MDEKIRTKAEEVKESDTLNQKNHQSAKEKARETWSKAKNWLGDKWDSYGKHTYTADGFSFDTSGIYLTIKIGVVRNTMYFSDTNSNRITQNFN